MRKQFLPAIAFGFIFAFALLFSGCDLSPKYSVYFYSTNDKNAMLNALTQSDLSPGTAITLPSGAEAWRHKNNGNRQYSPGDLFIVDDNATFIASDWTGGTGETGGTETSATLSRGTLYTSSISYAPIAFTFSATSGTSYRIYWRDYNLYNIFADINVAVGSGSPVNVTSSRETFGGQYCFYQTYTATSTGTVTIRVSIQSLGLNGTFYIGYN